MGEGPTAALLQQIFDVDPLACPTCHGVLRLVACITQPSVIDPILPHLHTRATTVALAGSAIAPYVHRILARPRLNFLSR